MKEDNTYKILYYDLKKQFDTLLKHKNKCPKKCKYCKEWYDNVETSTKRIKNKKIRDNLMELWETLWLNNCKDFDIIAYTFDVNAFLDTVIEKEDLN